MTSAPKVFAFLATATVAAFSAGGVSKRAAEREAAAHAAFPPIGQMLDVRGTPVHAYVTGNGPDVVLIHGAGGNLRDATFQLTDLLSSKYRVIAFDRPGHGYTGHPDPTRFDESPITQAALLQAASRQLGVQNPIVVGHSFGGAVAMAWGLEFPEQTAALVILSGATMPWPGKLDASYRINGTWFGRNAVIPMITAFVTPDQTNEVLGRIFAPQQIPEGYAEHFGLPLSTRRATLRANAQHITKLRPHIVEMSARYPQLALPVELLHGTADTIVPLTIHSAPLSQILPDARLTVMDAVGHMPQHADPKAVLDAINRAATRARLH